MHYIGKASTDASKAMHYCRTCTRRLFLKNEIESYYCRAHSNVPKLINIIKYKRLHWAIRIRYLSELHRICKLDNKIWTIGETARLVNITPGYCGKLLKLAEYHKVVPQLSKIDSWITAYALISSYPHNTAQLREVLENIIKESQLESIRE